MTLDEYLSSTPDTAAALAARCGISPASISRIRKGGQNISLSLARTLVEQTGGKVTLDDLAARLAA